MSHGDPDSVVAEWLSAVSEMDWARAAALSDVGVSGSAEEVLHGQFGDVRRVWLTAPPRRTEPNGALHFEVEWQKDGLDGGGGLYTLTESGDELRVVVTTVIY